MSKMKKTTLYLILLLSICGTASAERPRVDLLEFDDLVINPVSARFFTRAMSKAHAEDVECLIIRLDTPGGLMKSMEFMYKEILNSRVPVVVYVAPKGAQATSAGVFVALSAHITAMAPETQIGSAHPVAAGGAQMDEDVKNKMVGHTVGAVKKIAAGRGRNVRWAEAAVRDGDSSTEEEALVPLRFSIENLNFQGDLDDGSISEELRLELKGEEEEKGIALSDDATVEVEEKGSKWLIHDHKQTYIVRKEKSKLNLYQKVIDLIAEDLDELLEKIDGWKVVTESGEHILNTRDANINQVEMSFTERLLSIIADPNIAYMLMILGFYGVFFELSKPGSIFPGVVGGICLILAFFAFQVLPVNYAGVLLILFAIGLFVLEIKITSYGLLSVGGIVAMLVGSMMLINTEEPFAYILEISWKVILSTTLVTAGLFIIAVILIIKTHMKRPITGREGLIGATGTCEVEIDPEGKIFVHGELWNSISDEVIHPKEKVKVVGVDGLTLTVEKLK